MARNNPVGWFEIYVQDAARARAFYEAVFQITLQRLPVQDIEMWAFGMDPEAHGSSGALVKMPGVPSGGFLPAAETPARSRQVAPRDRVDQGHADLDSQRPGSGRQPLAENAVLPEHVRAGGTRDLDLGA